MKLHVDGKTYDYDEDRMTNVEAMAIEKVTGLTFAEWAEALTKGSMLATTALVWVIQKRDESTLRFTEVEFSLARLDIESDEDVERAVENLRAEGKAEALVEGLDAAAS